MFRNMSAYITSICASKKKMREQMRVTSYEYRMSFKPSEVELKLVVFYTAFFFCFCFVSWASCNVRGRAFLCPSCGGAWHFKISYLN